MRTPTSPLYDQRPGAAVFIQVCEFAPALPTYWTVIGNMNEWRSKRFQTQPNGCLGFHLPAHVRRKPLRRALDFDRLSVLDDARGQDWVQCRCNWPKPLVSNHGVADTQGKCCFTVLRSGDHTDGFICRHPHAPQRHIFRLRDKIAAHATAAFYIKVWNVLG